MVRRHWLCGAGTLLLALGSIAVPVAAQDSSKDEKKAEAPAAQENASGAASSASDGAELGKPVPDFVLKGTDGKTYKLSELKDKTVVLEWINKDCPACKQLKDKMKETAESLAKKEALWLAIDSTGNRKIDDNIAFVKDNKLPYPILDDSEGAIGRAFGAKRTPTMYVVHKGVLVYSGALVPQRGGDRNYVLEAVEAVLAGKEPPIRETTAYG